MKYFKKLVGERIYLSPISIDDAEKYVEWMNDFKVTDGVGRSSGLKYITFNLLYALFFDKFVVEWR